MKLAIMQPYFFPYIGYFQLINAVEKYILYDRLNFIKEAWMNRNRILNVGNGQPIHFRIPLISKSFNDMINEVKIHNQLNWRVKLLKTIFLNYKRAPFFNDIYPLLENIIIHQSEYLFDFNNHSIIEIAKYLKIETLISTNEPYFDELEEHLADRKQYFHGYDMDNYPVKVLRILEICKKENANVFYNAIGGQLLYNKELFKTHNIELGFIETKKLTYSQYQHEFVSSLSIIDVMMFNSLEKINEMFFEFQVI